MLVKITIHTNNKFLSVIITLVLVLPQTIMKHRLVLIILVTKELLFTALIIQIIVKYQSMVLIIPVQVLHLEQEQHLINNRLSLVTLILSVQAKVMQCYLVQITLAKIMLWYLVKLILSSKKVKPMDIKIL